jgi:glycosyltransferase involved in cell wall biosynthesis
MIQGILYVSYDGMMAPLGRSQVLGYLTRLAVGRNIHLISFEKADDWANLIERERLAGEIANAGIKWHPLRYHKWPTVFATSFDIALGFLLSCFLIWRNKIAIVHARSYVPAVIALGLKRLIGIKFIFDMRGFWADEKVDNGSWPKGCLIYRIAKGLERHFLLAADRVVSLTRAGVDEMRRFDYLQDHMPVFEVITTCTDIEHFRRLPDNLQGDSESSGKFTVGYVGSATYSYLFDEVLECFKLLRELKPCARLLVLNRGEHAFIRARLVHHGMNDECVELRAVDFKELPSEISRMDASIFFIRQVYAKIASAPTKLGELLACGVPCLSNAGVGDMTAILEGERVGIVVNGFGRADFCEALPNFLKLVQDLDVRTRCRNAAERHLSLAHGVRAYARMYEELSVEPSNVEKK